MRVLGIDPGSRRTGFGVVETEAGALRYVASGCIKITESELPARLQVIYSEVGQVIDGHQPEIVVVEQVFMARNAQSALTLGQARGAALVACSEHGLDAFEYTANQVKQATVGKGHAAKQQVQHMVKVLLCLEKQAQADAADALAIALCHGHSRTGLMQITGAAGVRRGRLQ